MKAQYGPKSPYSSTRIKSFYLDTYVDRPIPESEDDTVVEITSRYENRPDLLSFDLYGTSKYWWIFKRRNPASFDDPVFDFVSGIEIMVPTLKHLEETLN